MRNWNPLEPILFFRRLNQNKSLRSYALSSRKWVAEGHFSERENKNTKCEKWVADGHFSAITTAPAREMGSKGTFLRDNHRPRAGDG